MKFAKILVPLCLMAFIAVGTAHAGLMDMFAKKQVIKKEDIYPIQHDEQFQDVRKSYHRTPFGDPELEYEISVPKDWASVDTAPTQGGAPSVQLMGNLDKFKSPVIYTKQAVVTIQSIKLTREISAGNWLKDYIRENHYSFQIDEKATADKKAAIAAAAAAAAAKGGAVTPDKNPDGTLAGDVLTDVKMTSDRQASAECVTTSADGESDFVYMKVLFNGNNAVLVKFEAADALREVLDFISKAIVDSFRFVLETDHTIETQKSFNFADALKFRYPESLDPPKNVDDKDTRHMSMQLFNLRTETQGLDPSLLKNISIYEGLIRFVVVKRTVNTSLKKETDNIIHFIEQGQGHGLDLVVKKLLPAPDKQPQVSNRFKFYRYEIYDVAEHKSRTIDKELRFVALGDDKWYVFAIMETPSPEEDFHTWAVNTQDFDMIIKDFR
jgi:hypothetical protein